MTDKKHVTLNLPIDLTNKSRAKAIAQGGNLSVVVTAFLRAWLAGEIELPTPETAQPKAKAKKGKTT